MGKVGTFICVVSALAAVTAGACLWFKIDRKATQVLCPEYPLYKGYDDLPEKIRGVELTPFTVKGKDGQQVQVCLARATKEVTPRQQSLPENLRAKGEGGWSQAIDYVLVGADWDHGIRSALPLAEQLTAAGITCVLWEPRGRASARPFCTYGIEESKDVPLIIDELEKRSGRKDLMVLGVGKRYGADLLLHAAEIDPRLRAVAAVDTRASMSTRLKRDGLSVLSRELVGWRIRSLTGLEPFDIAAVQSVSHLPEYVPVLLAYTHEDDVESMPEDTIALYSQLHPQQRFLVALRRPDDPADASTREMKVTQKGGTHDVQQHAQAVLAQDVDEIVVQILLWMQQQLPNLGEFRPVSAPISGSTVRNSEREVLPNNALARQRSCTNFSPCPRS